MYHTEMNSVNAVSEDQCQISWTQRDRRGVCEAWGREVVTWGSVVGTKVSEV